MCAKREPNEVLQPLVDLFEDLKRYEFNMLDLKMVGPVAYYAVLANV